MKPAPFFYHRPMTVAEAIDVLSRVEDAKLLAGGQSLMPMMNFRYVTPANVVDLNRVHELAGIAADGDALAIGAMTRQSDIKDSGLVAACCPLLAEALHHVGHVQTRHRGTIGGSLAHLDPAAELPESRWISAFAYWCPDKTRCGANATRNGSTVPAGHTPSEAYSYP